MDDLSGLRKFVAPEFVFGEGARHLVGQYALNLGGRKMLLVTDPGVEAAGWAGEVAESLRSAGIPFVTFSGVTANPRASEVHSGAELFDREGCNAIVAVGGGSPMDCAKGIGILCANGGSILDYEGVDQVEHPIPPLICIPTTAGSSADVSQFAIISDCDSQRKIAIVSKTVVPDVALVDPATLSTLDRYVRACTGMDALSHAIEAYASNAHSPMTDMHALEAIRLIAADLVPSLEHPGAGEVHSRMMLGSLYAGLAFSNAILGAVHAMAHVLGGVLDLPHGECNAILLEAVLDYNWDTDPDRFEKIGRALGVQDASLDPAERKKAAVARIGRLKEEAGIGRRLGELGVKREDIPRLSELAMRDPCMVTNPRTPTREEIEALYEKAF